MAFPDDLSDVTVFKIHPAIGIARVSNNDDVYVFGRDPGTYKSDGLIKRQAVQFRIFAYGDNHVGLGELTPTAMASLGITAVWSAHVANRKVARLRSTPLGDTAFVIAAEASSDVNGGVLTGSSPDFADGVAIPMGQITTTGLFIPPKGGAYRSDPQEQIPEYPALSKTIADTTSDGVVSVRLEQNGALTVDVLPACIVVAPQDFSPDTNEHETLLDHLRGELGLPATPAPGNLHNQAARTLDEDALQPGTSDFAPGFEVSLGSVRTEVVDVKSVFYQPADDPRIDPREMRVRYKSPGQPGRAAVPGQLTSGLCSPWQGDFTDCVGYWTEHLPEEAFLDEDTQTTVQFIRKRYTDHSANAVSISRRHGDEFEQHVDKVGVVRLRAGKRVETERDPGDDIP